MMNTVYFYLLSPLHTGGTTQEGNLVGIARESHTNLPYIPSSTIRGRLRATVKQQNQDQCFQLFGTELDNAQQLTQGDIWVGDGSLLWIPVPSLSHGVVWISSPFLLRRWQSRQQQSTNQSAIPKPYSCNFNQNSKVYLKDAIIKSDELKAFDNWQSFVPQQASSIDKVLVLPDQHCVTLIQMSLWRQVKIKLDEHKVVDGGFRYEEAIPPDTLMYFTWGLTNQANGTGQQSQKDFQTLIQNHDIIQIGGQESLGRGFVQQSQ
jgi:CRISPR-associated protein Cmr4